MGNGYMPFSLTLIRHIPCSLHPPHSLHPRSWHPPHSSIDWQTLQMSEEEDFSEFGSIVHVRLNKPLGEADSEEEEDGVENDVEADDSDDGDYVPGLEPNYVQTTRRPQLPRSSSKQVTDYFQVVRPRKSKFDCVEIPVKAKQLPAPKKLHASTSASASISARASSSASSASISNSTSAGSSGLPNLPP
ncbi:hypothetical protein BC938DRAFT_481911, partial [Jimgerdemannia flammicorona]